MPRFFKRWFWIFMVCRRDVAGRWFIFRDAPDWFVMEVAQLLHEGGHPQEVVAMAILADAEVRLRIANSTREIERKFGRAAP